MHPNHFFFIHRGVKPETFPHSHPFSSQLTAASSSSLSHNSSLLACLCCTFILFVVTFPRPSHLSTWKTLMCLQRDIKASRSPQHSHWLFRFMAFFFPLTTWKTISVSRTDVCAWTPMHVRTLSTSRSPRGHIAPEWSVNHMKHLLLKRRSRTKTRDKTEKRRRKGGWKEWTWRLVRPREKVALWNKSSFECAPTQKRD